MSNEERIMPKINPHLTLLFINAGIVLGVFLEYRNDRVDKLSLLAIGGVSLLVLNGMFFAIRKSEADIPAKRLKQMNKWVVWPFIFLAGLIVLIECFFGW
jgi:hypothetical protein